jgi:hypothetical protein
MRPQYRNTDAGHADPDLRIGEDLATFINDFGLFAVAAPVAGSIAVSCPKRLNA